MKKTILCIDNNVKYLEVLTELLRQESYQVLRATSVREANEKLRERRIHLAIVDIRLRDEDDATDISGLELLRDKTYQHIPKIALTAYPSWNYAEKALGLAHSSKLVGMVDKADDPQVILDTVCKGFAQYVHINWQLKIRWHQRAHLSIPHLITLLETDTTNEIFLTRLVRELEDLFYYLFHDCKQINVLHLLGYRPGKFYLAVTAYTEQDEKEEQFIVLCGQKHLVKSEKAKFKKWIPADAKIVLNHTRYAETVRFAAITYTLSRSDLEQVTNFNDYYQRVDEAEVATTLARFFAETYSPWSAKGRVEDEGSSFQSYALSWLKIDEAMLMPENFNITLNNLCREALMSGLSRIVSDEQTLTVYLPGEQQPVQLPNPGWLFTVEGWLPRHALLCGPIHGRLDGNSILVDQAGNTWLQNLEQVQRAPLVFDFVGLETAVKTNLMENSNLAERLLLENYLTALSPSGPCPQAADLSKPVKKALAAITRIRQAAAQTIGEAAETYQCALFFAAMSQIGHYNDAVRHTRQELLPYCHLLLSAALLANQLLPQSVSDLPEQARKGLWIDEPNKTVYVEGNQISLSPREYELLDYLYQRAGQLCTRLQIATEAFHMEVPPDYLEHQIKAMIDGILNATMARLRKKVEPGSEESRYIQVVRGKGYILHLTP